MATLNPKPIFQTRVLRTYSKWADSQQGLIIRLQRWWRALKRLQPSNTADCITLEPVEKPVFLHVSDQGYVTAFTAISLAQYMATSGNFTHPQFRTPFNDVELWRLDRCTQKRFNLLQNRESIQSERATAQSESSLNEFLVNECLSFVQTGIDICSATTSRAAWARNMRDITEPFIMSYVTLAMYDQRLAQQMINQAIQLVDQQPATLLRTLNSDITTYFDACDRCFQFSVLLKTLRNDMAGTEDTL